jgi:glyoxylase-like metal-dependent hydrolase (beta-lactamase superfamily II)
MKRLADGVEQFDGFPPNAVNIYLADGVLFDSGTRFDRRRILRQLRGRDVKAHALTHGHPDHQGSSRAVCEALGIPLWCGAGDADAVESGRIESLMPDHLLSRIIRRLAAGPACPVARRLREGDEVGGFRVLDVPGHSPGHVAYWRESDRVLILGDVLNNMNLLTSIPGLHEPPTFFTPDPARNRRSAKRLVELGLEPSLVCFGHGPPLRDPAKFIEFIRRLPG